MSAVSEARSDVEARSIVGWRVRTCTLHQPLPQSLPELSRNRLRRAAGNVWTQSVVLALPVALGAVGIALWARSEDRQNWHTTDWATLLYTIALSLGFLLLAQFLQRRQAAQTEGLAETTLRDRMGEMTTSSLLSMSVDLGRAVNVGKQALAAMRLFPQAGADVQAEFLRELERAYSSIALNALSAFDRAPRAQQREFQVDGVELMDELDRVGTGAPRLVGQGLKLVKSHVELCLSLQRWFDSGGRPPCLSVDALQRLWEHELQVYCCWRDPAVVPAQRADAASSGPEVCLYRVAHQSELADAYAPWYVRGVWDANGRHAYDECDYSRISRGHGTVRYDGRLPTWPEPLQHRAVAHVQAIREAQIARMARVMRDADAITVMTYRLCSGKRLVLDGNHRLAAALRERGRRVSVYVFELREAACADTTLRHMPERAGDHMWSGFTPDVGHLRLAEALASPRRRLTQ